MRRVLAQFTEWTWSEGNLRHGEDIEAAAAQFLDWLKAKFPARQGSREQALAQIQHDMWRTYRVLCYGGRSRAQLVPERKSRLQVEANRQGWRAQPNPI